MLDQPVNLNEISKFIYNFHQGSLTRFVRSDAVNPHIHFFDFEELEKPKLIRNSSLHKKCARNSVEKLPEHIIIRELKSKEFEKAVMDSKKVDKCYLLSYKLSNSNVV